MFAESVISPQLKLNFFKGVKLEEFNGMVVFMAAISFLWGFPEAEADEDLFGGPDGSLPCGAFGGFFAADRISLRFGEALEGDFIGNFLNRASEAFAFFSNTAILC